ncbi:protein FAM171A1 isoform X2 [Bos indicus x Bos taurus]|uniref:Family with sequence similarity 171 member A1 n=1 Tax=Bos indicus x Bos taurus TaxID=30522 RepID=A0A4W2E5W0_BOBOX|nr:protein FAM171A1 isoform X2 [Bos indicus x Bos taurus]XP_061292107.1 protein FAM171A1 isoform X2 [Bos javanicus]
MSRSAALLLCLLGCHVWKAVTKTLREPGAGAQEVTLKVHISDASTHQPVPDALIEIFTNQVSIASGTSGTDGVAFIKFQYKLGSQLIVTATKHAYVPNSAPWKPIRLPVFSSLSLGLLPERSATLMVYEDVVQIVSGFQGARPQPRVHFQRRALRLPENTSYSDLTAFLTAASSPSEVDGFPYLRGLDGNGTGTWLKSGLGLVHQEGSQLTWTYIAPQLGYWVAAMSPPNPGPVVTQDITTYHTVFLLAILGGMAFILLVLLCLLLYYCRRKCLKPRQHHRKLQLPATLESSKRDQSTSMSHINLLFSRRESEFPGPLSVTSQGRPPDAPGSKELMSGVHLEMMSSNGEVDMHTPMLKLSYSTSQEFSSREELLSHKEEDKSQISFDNLTPSGTLGKDYHKSVEIFPLKARKPMEREGYESPGNSDYRRSYNAMLSQPLFEKQDRESQASVTHISTGSKLTIQEHMYPAPSSPEKDQLLERRPTECMMSRSVDHLERPTSFPRPGQLICCSSVDQVNDSVYRKVLPALVIPAHYMKLPGDHSYVGQPLVVPADPQLEIERLQAELSSPHAGIFPHPSAQIQAQPLSCQAISQQHLQDTGAREWTPQSASMSESLSIPASLNDAALAQMNSEVQLLTEKALLELGGGKPLPHPRAWFVSLDGRSNAHVRHSYIDLQRAGRNGSNDASLDSGVDMNEPKSARKGRGDPSTLPQSHPPVQEHPQKESRAADSSAYTQLVYLEDMDQSGSEGGTTAGTPEDSALRCLLDGSSRRSGGQLPSLQEETTKRISDVAPEPAASPDQRRSAPQDEEDDEDDDDQGEDKKSPWQKREERPLMAFNIK